MYLGLNFSCVLTWKQSDHCPRDVPNQVKCFKYESSRVVHDASIWRWASQTTRDSSERSTKNEHRWNWT